MFKFRRTKGHHFNAERQKIQKELFDFSDDLHHGFPHEPTALAWDPKLKLMAIGTKAGIIKIYGKSGVEYMCTHNNDVSVVDLFFLPNEGRIISLCSDNVVYLFEINVNNGKLEEVKECTMEGRITKISKCCLTNDNKKLLIGTEGGNICILDIQKFSLDDQIIYQEVAMQNVPEDYKINPGPVEAIAIHPKNSDKILIGYNRGLIVLWDNVELQSDQTYIASQELESLAWNRDGESFMSSHNDGTHVTWSTSDPTKREEATKAPYGPFPCKAIKKIVWNTSSSGDDFIIYSGGLPRASYGDRNAVTISLGEKLQTLDFTSKVIDFFIISDADQDSSHDNPHSLIVLAEEELIALDLTTEGWPVFKLPYVVSLHSSAIISTHFANNVSSEVWDKLVEAGKSQSKETYSEREWPISGGKNLREVPDNKCLLLTGHEDGTIKFWDASSVTLELIYKLNTAEFFICGEEVHEEHLDESTEYWPPFRKVGIFDPYSDDPRMAVKKLELDAQRGILVVACTAGQVAVFNISSEEVEKELEIVNVNIVEGRDGFHWTGHSALGVKSGEIKMAPGCQPLSVIQLSPPAAITAISLNAEWSLVGVGTAHGLCLVDYIQKKNVTTKCTLNANDLTGAAADTSISRRKSFKKSLRESFRKLRKGRSQRGRKTKASSPSRGSSGEDDTKGSGAEKNETAPTANVESPSSPESIEVVSKPVERQIEARVVEDDLGSIVRCLYFAQCYVLNSTSTNPTMWVGTNAGSVLVYIIKLPDTDQRENEPVSCQLAKEIQLKHAAPVINIKVFDQTGSILPVVSEGEAKVKTGLDNQGQYHKVLISSEEQFKVFSLPQLKPYGKYKVTAHEGSMNRKIGHAKFFSNVADKDYSENCITCLNNQGQLSIFSIPDLKRQKFYDCIKKEDINNISGPVHQDLFSGITTLVFSCDGQGMFLHSPCEFTRFSLSTKAVVKPECELELPEGARPVPEPEVEKEIEKTEESKKDTDKSEATPVVAAAVTTEDAIMEEETKEKEEEKPVDDEKKIDDEAEKEMDIDDASANPASESRDDDSKLDSLGDITIDSVKDHLGNMTVSSTEESTITVTKSADSTEITKTEVKTEEKIVTMTKTIVVNAEEKSSASATVNGHANSSDNAVQSEEQDD